MKVSLAAITTLPLLAQLSIACWMCAVSSVFWVAKECTKTTFCVGIVLQVPVGTQGEVVQAQREPLVFEEASAVTFDDSPVPSIAETWMAPPCGVEVPPSE